MCVGVRECVCVLRTVMCVCEYGCEWAAAQGYKAAAQWCRQVLGLVLTIWHKDHALTTNAKKNSTYSDGTLWPRVQRPAPKRLHLRRHARCVSLIQTLNSFPLTNPYPLPPILTVHFPQLYTTSACLWLRFVTGPPPSLTAIERCGWCSPVPLASSAGCPSR